MATILVAATVYRPVFLWLLDNWLANPYYSHGVLVLPIAAYVAWRRRARFAATPKRTHDLDFLWLAAGGALLVAGRLYSSNYMQGWSLLPLGIGTLLVTQGRARARTMMWPLAFITLVIPLPLLEIVFAPLQALAAVGASHFASMLGPDVSHDAVSITVNGMTFAIVPLCAGLSSTFSLVAVTAVALLLWPLTLPLRLAVYGLVIPVALLANVARITSTVLIAVRKGPEAATDFFHGPGGIVLYLVALVITGAVIFGARKFDQRRKGVEA